MSLVNDQVCKCGFPQCNQMFLQNRRRDDNNVGSWNWLSFRSTNHGNAQRSFAFDFKLPNTTNTGWANHHGSPAVQQGPSKCLKGFPQTRFITKDAAPCALKELNRLALERIQGHTKAGRLQIAPFLKKHRAVPLLAWVHSEDNLETRASVFIILLDTFPTEQVLEIQESPQRHAATRADSLPTQREQFAH